MAYKVLVVEDEESVSFGVKSYLERGGHAVDVASELGAARTMVAAAPYDVVVADLRLNGTHGAEGFELLGFLHDCHPRVRTILLSAFVSEETEAEARALGASLVLRKPVTLADLKTRLESIAGSRSGESANGSGSLLAQDGAAAAMRGGEEAWAASLSRVIAGFAHEVRNPLCAIQGLVDLLGDSAASEEEREILVRLRGQVDRVDRMIRTFTRLDLPQLSSLGTHSVEAVLARTKERLEAAAVELPDGIDAWQGRPRPALRTDVDLCAAILEELVRNAVESLGGAGRPTLLVTPAPGGGPGPQAVRFEVIDQGPGIPPRYQHRVYEPFFTTKRGRAGIGLTLARALAARIGAELTTRTSSERETVFALRVPGAAA